METSFTGSWKVMVIFKSGDTVEAKTDVEGYHKVGDVLTILAVGNRHSVNYNWDLWVSRKDGKCYGVTDYEVKTDRI